MNLRHDSGVSRRRFLRDAAVLTGCAMAPRLQLHGQSVAVQVLSQVAIVCDPSDATVTSAPVQWAMERLRAALAGRAVRVQVCRSLTEANEGDLCVIVAGTFALARRELKPEDPLPSEQESLAVLPGKLGTREVLFVGGVGARGLMYALTDLADAIGAGVDPGRALRPSSPSIERPANHVRGVMRQFVSDIEDKGWFNDREFWRRYFTMLAENRFNRFQLCTGLGYDRPEQVTDAYLYFAYPYLLSVPGYDVRATNLPDAERDRNLEMLRLISDEAAGRGIHFQLGLWTHAYELHDSPQANHRITGLTPRTHGAYCREALGILLRECPNIAGVTFRIHGESGVAEGSYDFWRGLFSAMAKTNRPLEIDMHAKGIDQRMIDVALESGLPVTVSPKFWAEHMGLPYHQLSIRPQERQVGKGREGFALSSGDRKFLRYGYGDLLKESRRHRLVHRVWPGTQRLLLWGDPLFAGAYSRAFGFCGSDGGELIEPLCPRGRRGSGGAFGRNGYADRTLIPAEGDFAKYTYGYRLWGRKLYDPDTSPVVWQRLLRQEHGPAAGPVEGALAHASRILPLVTTVYGPSASTNRYWPEMYSPMGIVESLGTDPYTDALPPKTMGVAPAFDPQLFAGADEYVESLVTAKPLAKYSRCEVGGWLDRLAAEGERHLQEARRMSRRDTSAFRRFAVDAEAQIGLGRFFADQFRVEALYSLYQYSGSSAALDAALRTYRSAREKFSRVARQLEGVYARDVSFGNEWFMRGHWQDRLALLDRDLAAMERRPAATKVAADLPAARVSALIRQILESRARAPAPDVRHVPPVAFSRREPLQVRLAAAGGAVHSARLHYRHAHQGEDWIQVTMKPARGGFEAVVPAGYVDSEYPLLYYFEVAADAGHPQLYPGLEDNLCNQPYFVARSAGIPAGAGAKAITRAGAPHSP